MQILYLLGYFIQLLVASELPEFLKHDYKLSLKYPFNSTALGFNAGGDVSYSERFIRVSPSIPNKSGYVFSDRKITYDNLMIDIAISVSGRGFVGGNGIGIWITDDIKLTNSGSYYGRNEDFKGFGIILSTSDRNMNRKDPFIFGVQNDGTKKASDFTDYTSKLSTILGGCFANYRNTPHNKFYLKIMVLSHKLTVLTDSINHGKGFEKCFEANLSLDTLSARGQHIGITANSLNIADDHDLYSLDVYEINPPKKSNQQKKELTDDDKKHIVDEVENEKEQSSVYGDAITVETIQHIMESQFHIMQKLEYLIKEKHADSSKSSSSQVDLKALEQKMDSLSTQIKSLSSKIDDLGHSMGLNAHALEAGLGNVHERLSHASDKINQAHLQTSQHIGKAFSELNSSWSWIKYTASIVGSAILVYGLLAMIRKKEERKFI